MKMTLVVDELSVPTRNIHASISALAVRKAERRHERTGAHCQNVMPCNHRREWHTNYGGSADWEKTVENTSKCTMSEGGRTD